jgi:hypothetical protein
MPKYYKKLEPQLLPDGTKRQLFYTIFNDDEAQISQLIDRLTQELTDKQKCEQINDFLQQYRPDAG